MDGYYTREDLLQLWVDSTDKSYNEPFVRKGDGEGLEVFNQAFAQFERIGEAINNTFQSMYILPFSGQTGEPASGDRFATVDLQVTRSDALASLFFLLPLGLAVLEQTTDHSKDGPVTVRTGRAYELDSSIAWLPGEVSTKVQQATSRFSGWGGNNPLPDTLVAWEQIGVTLSGTKANVAQLWPYCEVTAILGGDGFINAHIGQYLRFGAGYNSGVIRKVVSVEAPTDVDAGKAKLESPLMLTLGGVVGTFSVGEGVVHSISGASGNVIHYDAATGLLVIDRIAGVFTLGGPPNIVGTQSGATGTLTSIDTEGTLVALPCGAIPVPFILYETVTQAVTLAQGMFAGVYNSVVYLKRMSGAFDGANLLTGFTSGATATPTAIGYDPLLMPEPTQTASWEFLDWEADFGVTVSNEDSPEGGRAGMLDELGNERRLPRIPGESDADYRKRISKPEDVVSPNALLRAIIRKLDPLGVVGCFREVGQRELKGFFYDVDPALAPDYAFAWDLDWAIRPQDRWKVWLDYADMRAFFLVGIPPTSAGEFGFAYDNHPLGAYDSSPVLTFYDGYALTTANALKALWNDLNNRKAGGVGFELYEEKDGCVS